MALHIKEFSGIAGGMQVPLQPEIAGTDAAGLTASGTYDVEGSGGGQSIVELLALGAAHTYSVEGGAGKIQHIASGERLYFAFNADTTITVVS